MTNAALRPDTDLPGTDLPGSGLVARTRPLAESVDPLSMLVPDGFAWSHDGVEFATAGVLARVPVDDVDAALGAIEVDDPVGSPGTGAIAVGALPFDTRAPAELVIPATVIGRDADGRAWITELGPAHPRTTPPHSDPTRFAVTRATDRATWNTAVARVLDEIDAGRVSKVVLAREVRVEADAPFDLACVAARLRDDQPGCIVFAAAGLLGASPELLVMRAGLNISCHPMAGTSSLVDPEALARLAESAKNGEEHRLVIDAITEILDRWCEPPVRVDGPQVIRFGRLAHLATHIDGQLPAEFAPSALALARALHPTPAVGGTPRAAAVALIDALEPNGRGRYAAPVGWVDAAGNGAWAVALRSAEIDGASAVLRAGAGIVAGSVAADEWDETEAKLAPALAALVRP